MKTPKLKKPRMSHPMRAARRRRIAKAVRDRESMASIVKREGLGLGYVRIISRGQGAITLHRAMSVRLALQIVRRRQLGRSHGRIAHDLEITVNYVEQVVRIAEREGVLSGH